MIENDHNILKAKLKINLPYLQQSRSLPLIPPQR